MSLFSHAVVELYAGWLQLLISSLQSDDSVRLNWCLYRRISDAGLGLCINGDVTGDCCYEWTESNWYPTHWDSMFSLIIISCDDRWETNPFRSWLSFEIQLRLEMMVFFCVHFPIKLNCGQPHCLCKTMILRCERLETQMFQHVIDLIQRWKCLIYLPA
jgi:hypothetical protein